MFLYTDSNSGQSWETWRWNLHPWVASSRSENKFFFLVKTSKSITVSYLSEHDLYQIIIWFRTQQFQILSRYSWENKSFILRAHQKGNREQGKYAKLFTKIASQVFSPNLCASCPPSEHRPSWRARPHRTPSFWPRHRVCQSWTSSTASLVCPRP